MAKICHQNRIVLERKLDRDSHPPGDHKGRSLDRFPENREPECLYQDCQVMLDNYDRWSSMSMHSAQIFPLWQFPIFHWYEESYFGLCTTSNTVMVQKCTIEFPEFWTSIWSGDVWLTICLIKRNCETGFSQRFCSPMKLSFCGHLNRYSLLFSSWPASLILALSCWFLLST